MLLIQILCASLSFAIVRSQIGIGYIDINLLGEGTTFETEIRREMYFVKEKIADIKLASSITSASVKLIEPIAFAALAIDSLAQKTVTSMWENALITAISDATDLRIAQSKVVDMKSNMKTISDLFRDLSREHFTDASRTAIVHDIYTKILDLINYFAIGDEIFRKYPQLAIPPLSKIASLVVIFKPIVEQLVPSLARISTFSSCKVKDILVRYRRAVTLHRIENIVQFSVFYGQTLEPKWINPKSTKTDVVGRSFNPYGYITSTDDYIRSMRIYEQNDCHKSGDYQRSCTRDGTIGKEYMASGIDHRFNLKEFTKVYAELIRTRVEQAFAQPIESLNEICTAEVRNQQQPTGRD